MYRFIVMQTQISLTSEERVVLDTEPARTDKSLYTLVKDVVNKVYGSSRSGSDDLDIMRQTFGAWSDRGEDGAAIVEHLFSGSRLKLADQRSFWPTPLSLLISFEDITVPRGLSTKRDRLRRYTRTR